MKLRRRTLRRLGGFLLVAALVMLAGSLLQGRGARRAATRLLEERRAGLELLSMGDHEAALGALGSYLSEADPKRVERDFDARLAYAAARARVSDTGERHLEQSGRLLRELADDFPDHPRRLEALHLLMIVAAQGGEWQELRRLCDETLDEHPMDRQSLRMRRDATAQLGDYSSSLADTQRLASLSPGDVEEQVWALWLLARLQSTPEQIVRYSVDLAARNPQDPRYLLVLALAYRNAGQIQQAMACLNQAAQTELPRDDAAGYVGRLAGLFDTFSEHALARQVYADAVARLPAQDPARDQLRQLLALRLWQAGRLEEALATIPQPTADERRRHIELYATRILLQFEKGDAAQAQQGLATLSRMAQTLSNDAPERRKALAWHESLSAAYAPQNRTSRQRLEALAAAYARVEELRQTSGGLATDQPSGLFLKWSADRWAELGETEQAIEQWRRAASAMPGWDDPLLRIAQTSMEAGLLDEAQSAAQGALSRAEPGAEESARVLLAQVAYARWLAAPSTGDAEHAAALAAAHQRARPLDPQTLPMHVHLLALTDPQQARRLVQQRLERGADPQLRIELARVSTFADLGQEQELLEGVIHPEAALLRSMTLAQEGDPQRALELLEDAAAANATTTAIGSIESTGSPIQWQVARARFLTSTQAPEAAATWRRLGASYESDVAVQLAILEQSYLLAQSPELIAQTIDRLAQLTGPAGRRWRVERSRFLLARRTPEAALEAADLLRALIRQPGGAHSVDERVMLAEALLLAGNVPIAIEHLESAYSVDATRGDVGLRLISLYEHAGPRQKARRILGQLAAEGVRGARHRLEVAARLAEVGEIDLAVGMLHQTRSAGQLERYGQVFLAELLHRAGKRDDAESLYLHLLFSEEPIPEAILSAAVFYAQTGRQDQAEQALAHLKEIQLSGAERHAIRASYLRQTGQPQQAREAYAQALAAQPGFAAPWREAVAFEIGCGNAQAAGEILARALQAGIKDERLDALRIEALALGAAGTNADRPTRLLALADVVLTDPRGSEWRNLADALGDAAAADRDARPLEWAQFAALERAAEVFGHFAPLHAALVDAYRDKDQPAEAARVAVRLALALPHDPAAQRLAFEALRDAGSYAQAEYCALRWQQAAPADSVWADAAVAEARLLAGDYAGASEALSPHVARAGETAVELARLLTLAAEVHAAMGDYPVAFAFVAPHLADSPSWRAVATRLAAERIADADEAVRWLTEVELALKKGDASSSEISISPESLELARERLALANGWGRIGARFGSQQARERARAQLLQLASGPLAQDPDAWEALASASSAVGLNIDAEAAYRRVLTLDPRRPSAADALARLLIRSDEQSLRTEAMTWARIAVDQDPSEPAFHSTLARAHLAARSTVAARDAFERALRLDDHHLDAMLGLALLLLESGETDTAARWYARVRPLYRTAPPAEASLRAQFQLLEQHLGEESS